jgi:hypothetical protein
MATRPPEQGGPPVNPGLRPAPKSGEMKPVDVPPPARPGLGGAMKEAK